VPKELSPSEKLVLNTGGQIVNHFIQIAVFPDGTTKPLTNKTWWSGQYKPKPKKVVEKLTIENEGVVEL
jgi:hypothetical protein